MKALVLSGGIGTRLRPLSYCMPKQLVPVGNEPVLFYCLEALQAAGITDAGIIVGASGTAIHSAVGDGSRFGMRITYLPQDEPRGLAHCVAIARDFLGDDDFVMSLADNVFLSGITEPLNDYRACRPDAQIIVVKVADPSQYGVAEVDGSGRVNALEEKPSKPRSHLAVTGTYFFTSAVHEAVRNIRPSWRNEQEITDALQWLVDRGGNVRAHVYSGYWKDTGNIADLLECNRFVLETITPGIQGTVDPLTEISGPVVIEPGARVERSRIVGPSIIGAGSTVEDSRVGPYTSVGSGCILSDAGVEDSVLLDRASIHGVDGISESLIGRAADIRRDRRRLAHRLVVGDDCQVEIASDRSVHE